MVQFQPVEGQRHHKAIPARADDGFQFFIRIFLVQRAALQQQRRFTEGIICAAQHPDEQQGQNGIHHGDHNSRRAGQKQQRKDNGSSENQQKQRKKRHHAGTFGRTVLQGFSLPSVFHQHAGTGIGFFSFYHRFGQNSISVSGKRAPGLEKSGKMRYDSLNIHGIQQEND